MTSDTEIETMVAGTCVRGRYFIARDGFDYGVEIVLPFTGFRSTRHTMLMARGHPENMVAVNGVLTPSGQRELESVLSNLYSALAAIERDCIGLQQCWKEHYRIVVRRYGGVLDSEWLKREVSFLRRLFRERALTQQEYQRRRKFTKTLALQFLFALRSGPESALLTTRGCDPTVLKAVPRDLLTELASRNFEVRRVT